MNKSLVTNGLAAAIIVTGLFWESPWQPYVLNTGLFAFSGGITNWLAIFMLFERIPGLYGSGVIPAHFEEFKHGIRDLVMQQFFNEGNIRAFFNRGSGDGSGTIRSLLEAVDLDKAFDALVEVIMASSFGSMLGVIGGRKALDGLRDSFREKIAVVLFDLAEDEELRQKLREQSIESLSKRIEPIVEQRLEQLTPALVKEIVQDMIRRHLGWLVVWGGVFGGLIGLVSTWLVQNRLMPGL